MLDLKLDCHQGQIWQACRPGRIIVAALGRGTGKTWLGRAKIHKWALEEPGVHVGLLMPSLKQARAVFWPGLLDDYHGPLKHYVHRPNQTELTCRYANGSRLTTWGAENAHSIRGQRFGRLVQDEADDIDPAVERAVVGPTFSRSGVKSIWLKTGTPRRGRYGILYRDFQLGQVGSLARLEVGPTAERYVSFRIASQQSPQVDQVWLAQVRAELLAQGQRTIYEREYECNFDAAEGLVYPMFDVGMHVKTAPNPKTFHSIIVGADHGFNDPGVILCIGLMGSGRETTAHVFREIYERGKDPTWWLDTALGIKKDFPGAAWYPDPSRADVCSLWASKGIWVREVDNAIEDGLAAVTDLLAARSDGTREWTRLFIDPSCRNTILEAGKYRRKRDKKDPERVMDEIEKGQMDHAMDALRYAVLNHIGRPPPARGMITTKLTQ